MLVDESWVLGYVWSARMGLDSAALQLRAQACRSNAGGLELSLTASSQQVLHVSMTMSVRVAMAAPGGMVVFSRGGGGGGLWQWYWQQCLQISY